MTSQSHSIGWDYDFVEIDKAHITPDKEKTKTENKRKYNTKMTRQRTKRICLVVVYGH